MAAKRIRVSADEAKRRADAGEAVLLDVVDTETYAELGEQVAGAVRIDPGDFPDHYEQLPRDHAVFAY